MYICKYYIYTYGMFIIKYMSVGLACKLTAHLYQTNVVILASLLYIYNKIYLWILIYTLMVC